MVFDMPHAEGGFVARLAVMKETVAAANVPHLVLVEQWDIGGAEELRLKMEEITAAAAKA